jgi:hypothetical protein
VAFVKLDDQIAHHPKVLRAGAEAAWLWACAIAYCNRQLTDGHVPTAALSTMGAFRTPTKRLAAVLVSVELFEVDGDGYRVHDYLSHNPDRVTVLARMRDASDRKARSRARVPRMSQRDTNETPASSRAHVPTPTPTPTPLTTDTESASVVAHALPDEKWGALPTRRRKLIMAWEGRREGLGVPADLHVEFLAGMGTPDERALFAWYAETDVAWQGRAIGETCWQFWRSRFAEWVGVTPKGAGKADRFADDGWMPTKLRQQSGGGA